MVMIKCVEVTNKRKILTAYCSQNIYNRETNKTYECRDEELFDSIIPGDFIGIRGDQVIKRIPLGSIRKVGKK